MATTTRQHVYHVKKIANDAILINVWNAMQAIEHKRENVLKLKSQIHALEIITLIRVNVPCARLVTGVLVVMNTVVHIV